MDIVDRLRYCADRAPNYSQQMLEAADAIEAFRNRVADLEKQVKDQALQMITDFGQYSDEIERMRNHRV